MRRNARLMLIVILTIGLFAMACGLCNWSVDPPGGNIEATRISAAQTEWARGQWTIGEGQIP